MPAPEEIKDNQFNKKKDEEEDEGEDKFPSNNTFRASQNRNNNNNTHRTRRQSVQAGISALRQMVNTSDEGADDDSSFDSDLLSEFTISDEDEEINTVHQAQVTSTNYQRNPVFVKNIALSLQDEGFTNYSKHLAALSDSDNDNSSGDDE
eukprot:gene20758-26610_t